MNFSFPVLGCVPHPLFFCPKHIKEKGGSLTPRGPSGSLRMSKWERELGSKEVQEGNSETENHERWNLRPSTDNIGNTWEKEKVKADKPLKQFRGNTKKEKRQTGERKEKGARIMGANYKQFSIAFKARQWVCMFITKGKKSQILHSHFYMLGFEKCQTFSSTPFILFMSIIYLAGHFVNPL